MVYAYVRYSTQKQEDVQQMNTITDYAEHHRIVIDSYERDEGVSGGVSYRNRHLNRLISKLQSGDVLIVSEISRLGRSMSDLNKLVNDELKPRGVRLIAIKTGVDMDCANLKAVDEMILFAFSFASQIEKEMTQQRTKSALDARQAMIKQDGGFFSKSGRWCKHLGRPKGYTVAPTQLHSARIQADKAAEWRNKSPLIKRIKRDLGRGMTRKEIVEDCRELYDADPVGYGTRNGRPLSEALLCQYLKYIELPRI